MGNIGPNFNQPRQQPMAPPPASVGQAASSGPALPPGGYNPANAALPGETAFPLAPLFAFNQAISTTELMLLLKNLLQMPRELVQFLAMFARLDGEVPAQELLRKLLSQDAQIPLEELQQFLQTHGDKCEQKLLKLLQSSNLDRGGAVRQMGDAMSMLSQLTGKAGQSPTEALHSTLALYLPYCPVGGPQRFSLHFEPPEDDGEGGGGQNAQLVVFIETMHLGQFRISLSSAGKYARLEGLIEHDLQADAVIGDIETQVKDALRVEGAPPPELVFRRRGGQAAAESGEASANSEIQTQAATPDNKAENQPKVAVHPGGGVSVASIHAAYLLIRIILELDNRQALHQNRAKAV